MLGLTAFFVEGVIIYALTHQRVVLMFCLVQVACVCLLHPLGYGPGRMELQVVVEIVVPIGVAGGYGKGHNVQRQRWRRCMVGYRACTGPLCV
ncbi:unnamed protein product [Pieris macdunnoughi]|uniref:Uncharacterized protein n=1 Tax=Pieris macdunnoughi TaxID=345717 RepID=A0A821VZW4_9NEOP|nr:unnamed protein product [Pieris macdunnoughi]